MYILTGTGIKNNAVLIGAVYTHTSYAGVAALTSGKEKHGVIVDELEYFFFCHCLSLYIKPLLPVKNIGSYE